LQARTIPKDAISKSIRLAGVEEFTVILFISEIQGWYDISSVSSG